MRSGFERKLAALALLVALALAPAAAQADDADFDNPFRALAKLGGLATDTPPPPDFIQSSRPSAPDTPIPIFQPPQEPTSKVMSKDDLKSLDKDLETTGKKHDALRAAFPPSAKAVADAAAARKAKDAAKKAKSTPTPTPTPQ